MWKIENVEAASKVVERILSYEGAWVKEDLEKDIEEFIRANQWPMGKVMNCLRLALTGCGSGLGIADIVIFTGKEELGRRFAKAKETLNL